MVQYNMGDYTDYPKLRLAHFHHLLKLTLPIHYLSFGKDGVGLILHLCIWELESMAILKPCQMGQDPLA